MRPLRNLALAVLGLLGALAPPAQAQVSLGGDRYEGLYGPPTEVSLVDLLQNPDSYQRRSVRTRGRLDFGGRAYLLRDSFSNSALIEPVGDVASEWESEARKWLGREVEITGVVFAGDARDQGLQSSGVVINFWAFLGPPEPTAEGKVPDAPLVTLETLLARPGAHDGKLVRVVGKFRGKNLYGDLPSKSQRGTSDWVIKDELYAAWITGRKPKGRGWELDSGLKRDTGKWIEVVGKVQTVNGVTYLAAQHVALSSPPRVDAKVEAPPPPPPRPRVAPVVVFALPLDGEAEVARSSRFVVQFSKDMDEGSFDGHVVLRYAGPVQPGDRGFDGLKLTYDGGRRALTVDPGDVLRPNRQLELLLLPGIKDTEGMELVARSAQGGVDARAPEGAVDVLRYFVGSEGQVAAGR